MSEPIAQSPSVEAPTTDSVEVTPSQTEVITTPTPEVPNTETTPTTGAEPVADDTPVLSDEEVNAIVAEMLKDIPSGQVTEPTFFPKKDGDVADDVQALKIAVDTATDATVKAEEAQAKLEATEAQLQQFQIERETIAQGYGNVMTFLGTELADKIADGNFDEVPKHLNPENWKKVAEHPWFGPQVQRLLKGEEIDLPNLIKEAIGKRQSPLPDITNIPAINAPVTKSVPTTQQNLIRSMRALHGAN